MKEISILLLILTLLKTRYCPHSCNYFLVKTRLYINNLDSGLPGQFLNSLEFQVQELDIILCLSHNQTYGGTGQTIFRIVRSVILRIFRI